MRNYLNFYGNLMRSSDSYLVNVLDKLEETGLFDDTLIVRTADHGEMGLTHGGLRQKNFNFYEEATRVPLVYSNPKLFPQAAPDRSAGLPRRLPADPGQPGGGAEERPRQLAGRRLLEARPHPLDAKTRSRTTSSSPTTTYQSGQKTGPYPKPPNHIVSIREGRWKLAKYHDISENPVPPQWEMYDLKTDPLESQNLAFRGHKRTKEQDQEFQRLKRKLARVEKTRLRPTGSA